MSKAGTQTQQQGKAAPMIAFARLTKVDEEKRLVYGRAAQQVPDRQNEELDYDTSKPYFERWSKSQLEASMGKSAGNVRGMHGKVAAGILIPEGGLHFNDTEKAIDVVSHVTDDQEWKKVMTGTYTGFSIGGKYVTRAPADPKTGVVKYVADPSEISLVDRPAIPTATFFEVHKKDGSTAKVEFETATVQKFVEETIKVWKTGDKAALEKVTEGNDTRWGKTWDSLGGSHTSCAETMKGKVDDEHAYCKWLEGKAAAGDEKFAKPEMMKVADVNGRPLGLEIEKSLLPEQGATFEIGGRTFAYVRAEGDTVYSDPVYEVVGSEEDLAAFSKAVSERKLTIKDVTAMLSKDEKAEAAKAAAKLIEDKARELCKAAGKNPEDFVQEDGKPETKQPLWKGFETQADGELKKAERKARIAALLADLEKAEHSDAAEDAQMLHDAAVKMGAKCAKQAADAGSLAKNDDATLAKMVKDEIEKANAPLLEKIAKLEAQPMPTKVQLALRAVTKSDDGGGMTGGKFEPVKDAFGNVNMVATVIKALQAGPDAITALQGMVDPDTGIVKGNKG